MKMINLIGQKFGRLTVQDFAGKSKNRNSLWICICDCGNTTKARDDSLKSGVTMSCGCYRREQSSKANTTHGQCKSGKISSIYGIWHNMMMRCYNPNHNSYKSYGQRGIRVCERWHTFNNFYKDMGNPPEEMTLDRKDNNGYYCPENCRWATRVEQQNNARSNVWKEYGGEWKTLAQWTKFLGLPINTLYRRFAAGWSTERALSTPVIRKSL